MKKTSYFFAKHSIATLLLMFIFSGNLLSQDLNPTNWPSLVGYWQFQDTTDLTHATVGNDLILIGQHQSLAGPSYGDTAVRIDTGSYYKVYHGIAANGGGDSVNQYSLMFDFRVLNFDRWHCFQQTDTTNANDADCFIKPYPDSIPGTIGVGYTEYSADSITRNEWYRLIISVNLGQFYNYYLNGVLIHTGDTTDIQIDDRFALTEAILFFADNNQEDDTIDIASIAIFDTCLSPSQIAQIGSIDPCVANPPIVYLGNDTTICGADSLVLSIGTGYESYLWSTGDTSAQIVLSSSSFGMAKDTVWALVTDINNCQSGDSMLLDFAIPPYIYMPTDTFKCYPVSSSGPSTLFNFSIDSTYDTYLWSTGDTSWFIELNLIVIDTGYHTIWTMVTDSNKCSIVDTMILFVSLCESIDEQSRLDFQIYPNPSDGNITLKLSQRAEFIQVYNSTGQMIRKIQGLDKGTHLINLEDLSSGIYYINIRGVDYNAFRKILIR